MQALNNLTQPKNLKNWKTLILKKGCECNSLILRLWLNKKFTNVFYLRSKERKKTVEMNRGDDKRSNAMALLKAKREGKQKRGKNKIIKN